MVALGSGEKQGAWPLKEEVWRHALQAVPFLGLFCASLITLPIDNYPLRRHTASQAPPVIMSCPNTWASNCIDIHENDVLFIPPLSIPDILPQDRTKPDDSGATSATSACE